MVLQLRPGVRAQQVEPRDRLARQQPLDGVAALQPQHAGVGQPQLADLLADLADPAEETLDA